MMKVNPRQGQGRARGFAAGHGTPNLKGRPPGAKGLMLRALQERSERFPALLDIAMTKAEAGDTNLLMFFLARLIPAQRPVEQTVQFNLPDDIPTGDLPAIAHNVIKASARGEISLADAARLITGLSALAGAHGQEDDLRQRVTEIERRVSLRLSPRQIEGELSSSLGGRMETTP
jgi:hypothetical protein